MKNKNILITGGVGFIFSHVVEYFAKENKVWVIDSLCDGSVREVLPQWDNIDNINVFVRNINHIFSINQSYTQVSGIKKQPQLMSNIDVIIHAAAESNVDKSIVNSSKFLETNINGTYVLLEYAKQINNLEKFLFIDTDEVYGSSEKYCCPNTLLNPSNPYSASKASASHLCWAYKNTFGLPVQEVRMCNIIGKRQATTKLIPRVIECLNNNKEIPVYDGGKFTREYMDVRDVAPILENILDSGNNEIFNLTWNQEYSINEVIAIIAKIMNKIPVIKDTFRAGHDQCYRMKPHDIMLNKSHFTLEETIKWILGIV